MSGLPISEPLQGGSHTDCRRRRSLSSVQQIDRGVGLISDDGCGSSPQPPTCGGDRGVMGGHYWLHRTKEWHAGWSEQVSIVRLST
jgi:hypothetical protein